MNQHLRGGLLDLLHDGLKAAKCLPQLTPCHNFHRCRLEDLEKLELPCGWNLDLWVDRLMLKISRLQPSSTIFNHSSHGIPWHPMASSVLHSRCQEAAPRQSPAQNLAAEPWGIKFGVPNGTSGLSGPTKLLVSSMKINGNVIE